MKTRIINNSVFYWGGAVVGGGVLLTSSIIILFLLTYKHAMETGKNSLIMQMIGRRGCAIVMRMLGVLSSTERGKRALTERLRSEALERIEQARSDSLPSSLPLVCFVGSSTFTYWTNLNRDMAPLRCSNLAFGGSRTFDLLEHVEAYTTFAPQVIVYYCGTNDLSAGCSPRQAADGFVTFFNEIRRRLPGCKVVYLSVSLVPMHAAAGRTKLVHETNTLVKQFIESKDLIKFVDITADKRFTENHDWYLNDGLHLTDEGHIRLSEHLKPVIEAFLNL